MATRAAKRKRREKKPPTKSSDARLLALLREKYAGVFETMSAYERQLALQALREIRSDGASLTLDAVWNVDYLTKPVTVEQFLEDDYFLGGDMTKELYPLWKKELSQVFNPNASAREWIFGGAIGTGKTTVAAIAFTYMIYRMSCLRDPHAYYGLMKGSTIVFGIYSVTKTQAYDSSFSKVQTFIDSSPYFMENFPRVKHIKSKIVFKKGSIQVIAGSRELHALGLDMFTFLLDEANFLKESGNRSHNRSGGEDGVSLAYKIYGAARTRLKCLAEGSLIKIPAGTIPIQEIDKSSGMSIITSDGVSEYVAICAGAYYAGEKECFRVDLDNGAFEIASPEHGFLVRCAACGYAFWKQLKELRINEDVITESDSWAFYDAEGAACACVREDTAVPGACSKEGCF